MAEAERIPTAPAGLVIPGGLWEEVRGCYSGGGRAYHNLAHIEDVLRRFDEVARDVGWERPREVFLALLFHDAVYHAGASDNEVRSAQLARDAIRRWLPETELDAAWVERLIHLTA